MLIATATSTYSNVSPGILVLISGQQKILQYDNLFCLVCFQKYNLSAHFRENSI